nr:PhoH family protein [Oscillospiraceae bacterium]
AAFRERKINRIILTRPAVEAGERLGFLPGDLQSKVDPYLRPLYDALFDMLGAETYNKYLERGNIEVAPLAYMRGRTLDDSFIILDEAQNTSCEQMKMFLTRMGFGSKMVITGDVTQIDLPADKLSGLKQAVRVLKGVEGVGICELNDQDVVRHVMVQRIIKAYQDYEDARERQANNRGKGKH